MWMRHCDGLLGPWEAPGLVILSNQQEQSCVSGPPASPCLPAFQAWNMPTNSSAEWKPRELVCVPACMRTCVYVHAPERAEGQCPEGQRPPGGHYLQGRTFQPQNGTRVFCPTARLSLCIMKFSPIILMMSQDTRPREAHLLPTPLLPCSTPHLPSPAKCTSPRNAAPETKLM